MAAETQRPMRVAGCASEVAAAPPAAAVPRALDPDSLGAGLDHLGPLSLRSVVVVATALAMALFHMAQVQFHLVSTDQFKVLHLTVALALTLLVASGSGRYRALGWRALLGGCAVLSVAVLVYILVEYDQITSARAFRPSNADTAVAVVLLAVALLTAYVQWGLTIPLLAVLGLLYGLYGYLLESDLLWHRGIQLQRLISYTSFPYFQGLLGGLTELSAGTVFLFMVYAAVLKDTGGLDLIMRLARGVSARSAAGPAQMAVVGSGLMGMISGSTVANIASTGAVTIPLMKRYGFSANFAGATEAVASMGGQVTPPVMGLAAFLVVGMTGIPYVEVVAAAAFPALIYYGYLLLAVQIRASMLKLDPATSAAIAAEAAAARDGQGGLARLLQDLQVLIGLAVLVALLLRGMPAAYSALYSILVLLGLDAARRLWFRRRRPLAALREVAGVVGGSLVRGALGGAQIATIVCVCGILIDIVAITGFAQKLSFLMLDLADGNLFLLLLLAAAACLVFGLGLPTSAAYIVVALLGAPSLVELGVPLLAAHFFVLYFANVSALTPPVALAAMVAAKLAEGDFLKTTLIAMRLGLPGFLLPFVFVAYPEILGIEATLLEMAAYAVVGFIAIAALNVALEGRLIARLHLVERAALLAASGLILWPDMTMTLIGAGLMALVALRQALALRRGADAAIPYRQPRRRPE